MGRKKRHNRKRPKPSPTPRRSVARRTITIHSPLISGDTPTAQSKPAPARRPPVITGSDVGSTDDPLAFLHEPWAQ